MKLNLFKIYGGKAYHAKWIIEHYPEDYEKNIVIEPCLGAANMVLQSKPAYREILGELHYPTHCIYTALQSGELYRAVQYLPYSREVFCHFQNLIPQTPLDHGVREYVLHRMSRGGMKKEFAWSDRLRGGIPGDVNAWNNAVANLPLIQQRLKNAVVINIDCVKLIQMHGWNPDVFFYIDPPYLADTRTSKKVYDIEFDEAKHVELLTELAKTKAKWLLSGYESKLYSSMLGEPIDKKTVSLSSSQAKTKRKKTECLWSNY